MQVRQVGKLTIRYPIFTKQRGPAPWTCIFNPTGAEVRESAADWLLAFAPSVDQFARTIFQSFSLMYLGCLFFFLFWLMRPQIVT